MMIEATKQGLGISLLGRRTVEDALKKGEVVTILEGFEPIPNYLIAMTPSRDFIPEKAKVFVQFLQERLDIGKAAAPD